MGTYDKRHSLSMIASSAVVGARLVSKAGAHAASSTDVVGISEGAAAVGKSFSAITTFSGLVEAAEVIRDGSPVKPAADGSGRAAVGSASDNCGWAVYGASKAGDMASVHVVESRGSVSGTWGITAAPYRAITYGDSRANAKNPVNFISYTQPSGSNSRPQRCVTWAVASLADTELVADYGQGGDTTTAWNSPARQNGKTINNALALNLDVAFSQYGMNNINNWNGVAPTEAAVAAQIVSDMKALRDTFLNAGVKFVHASIEPFSSALANAAAKERIRKAANAAMAADTAPLKGRAVFVDLDPYLVDPATGYLYEKYLEADGMLVHLNKNGGQAGGIPLAAAARTLLPQRFGSFTIGPTYQPNLINWDAPAMYVAPETAGISGTAPSWKKLAEDLTINGTCVPAGTPYAEAIFTVDAATFPANGTARARLEIHANPANCIGAAALYPIAVGDVLQGGAYVTIDNGVDGGLATVQSVDVRQRLYGNGAFFSDACGLAQAVDLSALPATVAGRFATLGCASTVASAGMTPDAGSAGSGYGVHVYVESPVAPQTIRVRAFMPWLRCISKPQLSQPVAGASPYTYTLNPDFSAQEADLLIAPGAGGTITSISIARGTGAAVVTGLTSGPFRLSRGDSVVVVWATAAPVITLIPR